MKKRMIISINECVVCELLHSVKYWLWSLYKWWHGSWVVHDLFRLRREAMRVTPDQIWTARLPGWVTMIASPCSGLSHHIRILRLKSRLIQKSSFIKHQAILLLKLLSVVVSWVKKFSLTPGTEFCFIISTWNRRPLESPSVTTRSKQPSLVMKCSVQTGTIPGHLYWSARCHCPLAVKVATLYSGQWWLMAIVQ